METMVDFRTELLSADTGVAIEGIDLAQKLDERTRTDLNALFVKHSVIVFRNQHLSAQQLYEGMQQFGELFPQHNARFQVPEYPLIHYISNQDSFADGRRYIPGEGYHTDHSNDGRPPKATVLLAVKLPATGGDTQFVNMHRAYDDLSDVMKQRLDKLSAIHVYQSSHSKRELMQVSEKSRDRVPEAVIHPLIRTHPETGRKAIYINPIRIEGILGMDHREALPLLDELLEHSIQEKYQYRHKWNPGDLVMWDNRCLLHKANGDYDMNQVRYLYRLMLKGSVPV